MTTTPTDGTTDRATLIVYAAALALFALNLLGALFPGSRNWGFHALGFLSPAWLVAYVGWAAGTLVLLVTGAGRNILARLGEWEARRPAAFFIVVLCCFIAAAFVFRVRAPLLGDSFTFIRNYTDFYSGLSPLAPWHEPVSMHFFAFALGAFGHKTIGEIQDAFFITDAVLGCAFLWIAYRTAARVFGGAAGKVPAFLFVAAAPYVNFFFGYVEIYSFVLTALALYAYLAFLVIERKFPFALLCAYGVFLVFVNYLNGLLWVSIGYLALLEYRRGRRGSVLAGIGVSAALALAVLVPVNFNLGALVDQSPISHFLSVSGDVSLFNRYSQAFTLFSWNHAVEVANYLVLVSPFAVVVMLALVISRPALLGARPFTTFLAVIAFSYLGLLAVVKIQQGMGNDWDVLAPYFYFIGLFFLALFLERPGEARAGALFVIVSMTFVHSAIYARLNSTVEPQIRRIESLFDTAMISQLGHYTISLHLSRYYDSRGDSASPAELWKRYTSLFPDDPRGYDNTIGYMTKLPGRNDDSITAVYERWFGRDPLNAELRRRYASWCFRIGNEAFAQNRNDRAQAAYEKVIQLDPGSAAAFNNLGSVFAEGGKSDSAVALFRRATELDSSYAEAFYNLGLAWDDLREYRLSAGAMRQAAALGNADAEAFLRRQAGRVK